MPGNIIIKRVLHFIGFFAIAVLIYSNGLHIPYYADDYQRVFTNPREAAAQAVFKANTFDGSYRPLETIVLGIIQIFWGWETFPFRILNLLFHTAGAFLVFHALKFWKINTWCALFAAIFVIVSQIGAAAVLGNDTQSQITGALFSSLSLWLLYRYLDSGELRRWRFICSILFFFLALISKETSTGLSLSIVFLIYLMQLKQGLRIRLRQMIPKIWPYAVSFVLYSILRMNSGAASPELGNLNLSIGIGLNIPINIGLFLFQSILPVSSMAVVKAVHFKESALLILIFLYTALFASVLGYGILKSHRRQIIKGLCFMMFFSWFPALILNHISELYVYNSLFFLAGIFGIAAEYYWLEVSKKLVAALAASCTILLSAGFTNAIGLVEKASSMKVQGDRAASFLPQIIAIAKTMPPQEWIYLVSPKDTSFEYSMYAIHGFRVSTLSDSIVRFYSHRSDVRVYAADSAECAEQAKVFPGIAFTYEPLLLRIHPIEPNFTAKFQK